MPISDPSELVAESVASSLLLELPPIFSRFKKSGEFDKLRRELLANSQQSSGFDAFKTRIEEIARDRLASGQLAYTAPDQVHKELMQEINRFPIVDRFASDAYSTLSDSAFKDGIRASIQRILREDRGQKDPPAPPEHAPPSQPSFPPPADSGPSVKEGEEAPIPPLLPPQEPALVPLVPPPGTAPEAQLDGKETDVDTINPAPLTDAPETVMSSPKSSPLSSPPGPS
ncbi:hypothetical protein K438DRAFT_1958597 [Mycena galopus ATCC 62051]|nr:hypothetical protein K438DRAFT_1958597 [Mycena galopus ATCC 62051]